VAVSAGAARFAIVACLIAAGCSKKAAQMSGGDAGVDVVRVHDDAAAFDAPNADAPNADTPDDGVSVADAQPSDAEALDLAGDRIVFSTWTDCGWSSAARACLCDGTVACAPVAGGVFTPFGSQQARVCAVERDICEYVVFWETEGGGIARRCRVPIDTALCSAGIGGASDASCVELFRCNLLRGDCPPDVMPGSSVIPCQ
jgi:hypothetical protein